MLGSLLDFLFEDVLDFCFETVPDAIEKAVESVMGGGE
jgi:hypothetical protein